MISKFWLYLGIILACSGIGTAVGIILIVIYVWSDIRGAVDKNNVLNNNVTQEKTDANYYSEDTAEEMK